METKPTPGPWYIKTRQARFDPTVVIEDGVCGPDGEQIKVCGMTLTSSAEAKANSRLISAVHDLLDALRLMVDDHFPDLPLDEQARRLTLADEAIAKAIGE